MSPTATSFYLPDLLAVTPFERGRINPYLREAADASKAWINRSTVLNEEQREFFMQGSSEQLVARAYPYAGREEFRTCCDFVNMLFVLDEVSDAQGEEGARQTGNVFLNALRDPNWNDGSILAQLTKDFRSRLTQNVKQGCFSRLLKRCEEYIKAVTIEASLRERGDILNINSFITLRRDNSGVPLCYALVEYAAGVELPDEVFGDPMFESVYLAAVDMICWSNDVYSYRMEQAKGLDGNNAITVLMRERRISLQAAANYVGQYFEDLVNCFQADRVMVRSRGPGIDIMVANYIKALEYWIIGNLEWSFETKRYLGANVAEIKKTRLVKLNPKFETSR